MPIPPQIVNVYKYIDAHTKDFIEELREYVKIPNVSSDPNADKHLSALIKRTCESLKKLGFKILIKQPNYKSYKKYKGNKPNIIVAALGKDPKKKTLLYYCHLDVLKVVKDKWKTDPFELTEKDGKFYGRGTAKMKGPLLCFIHAIEGYVELGIEIPINIKIICESMHECRSKGLRSILEEMRNNFLGDVDCILMTESNWLDRDYPCIVYGMRGVCYFNLTVDGPKDDLHSGHYGGIVREPLKDALYILNSLIDPHGKLKAPGFYDDVVPVTPDEEEFYAKIKIDMKEYRNNVGVDKLGHHEKLKDVLMHIWRYPWLNLHYINNSCGHLSILDIPKSVIARFSIRMVPNQTHEKVSQAILDYIHKLIKDKKTPNKIEVHEENSLDPWYENILHWNYKAANSATKQVYKEEANFIREGNGFPTLLKISRAIPKRNILILPIVNSEAKPHCENENISLRCYIEGTKLFASYFNELDVAAKKYAKEKISMNRKDICHDKL